MRVAFLSRMNGLVTRGTETWAANLCHHLAQAGHTCLFIQGGPVVPRKTVCQAVSLQMPMPASRHVATSGVVNRLVNRCYLNTRDRDLARFSAAALPYLAAFRPDIIMPTNYSWTVVAAKLAGWLTHGRPRIVVSSQQDFNTWAKDTLRLGIDGFVAIQPRTYDSVMEFERGRTPIALIPNAVDIDRFAAGPVAHVPLTPPIVIVVSALDDWKRVDLAVRAVAHAGMSLLLLGDGPEGPHIDRLAQTLLGPDRYMHIKTVPFGDVPPYYRAADVFTLPSAPLAESFGIVILEAMAAGLPVVVSDDPVRRWIVGENGLFVDPQNTEHYARVLASALHRPPDPRRDVHLAQFSWPSVAAAYGAFFERIRVTNPRPYSSLRSLPRFAFRVTQRMWDYAVEKAGGYNHREP